MRIKKTMKDKTSIVCDEIDLNDFNRIQPHGVWLMLDSKFRVLQYSENAPIFLETPLSKLLNGTILDFIKPESSEENVALMLTTSTTQYKRMIWSAPKKQILILTFIHQHDELITLEIEKNIEHVTQYKSVSDLNEFVLATIKQTLQCKTINKLAQTFCEEIKKLTEYHRVIIYQFDNRDHSGIVIGEASDKNMESYVGLRFPDTDIPLPVREMYIKLPLRYIPTISEKPVKIIPRIGQTEQSKHHELDLSGANLRMVAPSHVQYMINMGIDSALSVAIMQEERLWGLIACHHQDSKYLPQNYRIILSLLANIFTTQVLAIESTEELRDEQQLSMIVSSLAKTFKKCNSLSDAFEQHHNDLMELLSSQGMTIYLYGVLLNYGQTPQDQEIIDLISWLDKKKFLVSYYTESLPLEYKASSRFKNKACGLFAIKIIASEHHYLLFYKPERINTIAWAGNPVQSIKINEIAYSPRNSFERFLETIENNSSYWTKHDIKSAGLIHSLVAARQLQDLLQNQAMYDSMTQLLNRLYLEQTLSLEIQRAKRGKHSLVLMLIDLDYFKKINDKFGHQAGDALLQSFAQLIKTEFRSYDYKYRYGGEEFLILIPKTTLETAEKKANDFLMKTKKMKVNFNGKILPSITTSLGISSYPKHGKDAKTLITVADVALYEAKAHGRNRVFIGKTPSD